VIWTWRWNCVDPPAVPPPVPVGTGTLVVDWRWACEAPPDPLTTATLCVACNVAISVRIASPGTTGAVTQIAAPHIVRPTLPIVPTPKAPVLPTVSLPTVVVPASPPSGADDGDAAAASSSAPDAGLPGNRVARSPSGRAGRVTTLGDDALRSAAPERYGASVISTGHPAAAAVAAMPTDVQALPSGRAVGGQQPAATRRDLRTTAPDRSSAPPVEHRGPSGPLLPPATPLGAVAAAACGGAGHGGDTGGAGAAALLAVLLASLADLSRRLLPERLRLVPRRGLGRLERPG
jgi:hypothetical protein